MFYGVSEILFEEDDETRDDSRLLASLVEGLRKRFKVCARVSSAFHRKGKLGVVVAVLGEGAQDVNRQLDAITGYCEGSGVGRVVAEHAVVDIIDFENQA